MKHSFTGSRDFQKLNPHLFDANPALDSVPAQKPEPTPPSSLDRHGEEHEAQPAIRARSRPGKPRRGKRAQAIVRVVVIAVRHRLIDDDNLVASMKPIRDELAAMLGVDDGDTRVAWECGQVLGRGEQGVIVRIEAKMGVKNK